jgi:hypothetical protein
VSVKTTDPTLILVIIYIFTSHQYRNGTICLNVPENYGWNTNIGHFSLLIFVTPSPLPSLGMTYPHSLLFRVVGNMYLGPIALRLRQTAYSSYYGRRRWFDPWLMRTGIGVKPASWGIWVSTDFWQLFRSRKPKNGWVIQCAGHMSKLAGW